MKIRYGVLLTLFVLMILTVGCRSKKDNGITSADPDLIPPVGEGLTIRLGKNEINPTDYAVSDPYALEKGETVLLLTNESARPYTLTFVFSTEIDSDDVAAVSGRFSVLLDADTQKKITLTGSGGLLECLRIEYNGNFDYTNVYTEDGFLKAAKNPDGSTILPCAALSFDGDLMLTEPVRITLCQSPFEVKGIFSLSSTQKGNFILCEEKEGLLSVGDFFAETEKWDLVLPQSLDKVMNVPSFYLRAASLNGVRISAGERLISSQEHLEQLLDENRLPFLKEGDTLRFSGHYVIEKQMTFDMPLSFTFENGVTLEHPIRLNTEAACTVNLTVGDADLPDCPLILDAPNCDLIWDSCKLTLEEVKDRVRIRSVNGRILSEYTLGGDGSVGSLEISLLQSNNENLTEDIHWTREGYAFYATVDCVLNPDLLKSALLSVTVDNGGKVEFDSATVKDGTRVDLTDTLGTYFTVTDSEGKTCRYVLYTEYIPTKLPVIVIYTDGGAEITSQEEYIGATISVNCDYVDGFSSLDTTSVFIRGRGNSTWKMDKKPYKLKFSSKTEILGLTRAKNWVLLANYVDCSLIRNALAMDAAAFLGGMDFVPTQYPVDVFLNGAYIGVYSIGEQVEVKTGRVELTDNGTELDTGYLLEVGGTTSEDVWDVTCFQTELMKYVKIHAPGEETLTVEQVAYIKSYVMKADAAIMAGEGYEDYIDMESLIDWLILHELSYNLDSSFRRSCYLTKDAGGKLKMGPVWDFDLAFGNFNRAPSNGEGWACLLETSDNYLWTNWMTYLFRDPEFMEQLKSRWDEVKDELLEFLFLRIDELGELVAPSAEYNFKVWNILGTRLTFQPSVMKRFTTYEQHLEFLKEYITKRWNWMDANMFAVTDPIPSDNAQN
ncbi:MAG: CotH kinase family protein [Eubacteriales bacterium]